MFNTNYRKPLDGSVLEYFDARQAINDIEPGAFEKLPYTSRIFAENLVRHCQPENLTACLKQLIDRKRELDFPWYPARVVCHDILGQTALVDLAGLRDAIADQGGDPAKVNPVVPTQLIVDHSLAVEYAGFEENAFEKTAQSKSDGMKTVSISLTGPRRPLTMWTSSHRATASCIKSTSKRCRRWFRFATGSLPQTPV